MQDLWSQGEWKLPRDVPLHGGDNMGTTFGGEHCPLKIWEGKNVPFMTTFDFDCKYLWTGQRYRQAVNGNRNLSCVEQRNW